MKKVDRKTWRAIFSILLKCENTIWIVEHLFVQQKCIRFFSLFTRSLVHSVLFFLFIRSFAPFYACVRVHFHLDPCGNRGKISIFMLSCISWTFLSMKSSSNGIAYPDAQLWRLGIDQKCWNNGILLAKSINNSTCETHEQKHPPINNTVHWCPFKLAKRF